MTVNIDRTEDRILTNEDRRHDEARTAIRVTSRLTRSITTTSTSRTCLSNSSMRLSIESRLRMRGGSEIVAIIRPPRLDILHGRKYSKKRLPV